VITLTLLHPSQTTPLQHWTFEDESVIRVGRSTDNNVVLYSAVVSRQHIEIRRGPTNWELKNLGANGTFIDGKPITKTPVIDGMVIRLASSGPQIQIRLVAEEYASKSLIDRPDQAVSDDRDNHDKETITT
jgi:pSer/pThr/pTyr-binding forkhead associated (FHA) protein